MSWLLITSFQTYDDNQDSNNEASLTVTNSDNVDVRDDLHHDDSRDSHEAGLTANGDSSVHPDTIFQTSSQPIIG